MIETGNLVKFENDDGETVMGLVMGSMQARDLPSNKRLWAQFTHDPDDSGWGKREARAWVRENPDTVVSQVYVIGGDVEFTTNPLEPVV